MTTRRHIFWAMLVAVGSGILAGLCVLYVMHRENPQGEFFEIPNGNIVLTNSMPLLLLTFLYSAILALVLYGLIWLLAHLFRGGAVNRRGPGQM